jgi:hypothetical protein
MDSFHRPWTGAGRSPWWTNHHGRPWSSPELALAAALGHGGLPRGGGNDEVLIGLWFWASPKKDRRCGGVSTMAMVGGTMMVLCGLRGGVGDALR